MLKSIALLGIAALGLYAASAALAQSKTVAANLIPRVSPKAISTQSQRPPVDTARSLPDAPSAQLAHSAETLREVSSVPRLSLPVREVAKPLAFLPEAPSANMVFRAAPAEEKKGSAAFLHKYFYPTMQQHSRYQASSSDHMMARATDAASRVFLMRDPGGKAHVNTAYFLRVLTSVAAENASRRYRARSGTAPLSNFGSTVGNDAGMNLLHEFAPGIKQRVAGHMPEVVSRIAHNFSQASAR